MMRLNQTTKLWLAAAGLAVLFCLAGPNAVWAQCAMCRASVAGAHNAAFTRNFNIGVLVLLTPPVTIFCSIFIVAYRKRRSRQDESSEDGLDE